MSTDKMMALTFSRFGNANVLEYMSINIPEIKENEVLVKMKAIGLNYADIYRRKGNYHLLGDAPFIAGYEGAGIISSSKSLKYKVGDRVAFADVAYSNADYVVLKESHIIPLPEEIDYLMAAAVLLQGLTAQYLANDSHNVKAGETILVHAASGGVGQFLCQMCKLKGANVIGLTRNADKIKHIFNSNADYALTLNDSWKEDLMALTNNKGVDVVFDSVGSTLQDSFELTKDCGHIVFYGMSGGDPKAVDPRMLMDSSKTLTGGDLWNYLTSEEERKSRSKKLFELIVNGDLKIKEPTFFKLSQGKEAHEYLESGDNAGKIILIPDNEWEE